MISNYNKYPKNHISGFNEHCFQSWDEIRTVLIKAISAKNYRLIVVECYTGLDDFELIDNLEKLDYVKLIDVSQAYKLPEEIEKLLYPDVTEDRVFGKLTQLDIADFFDEEKLQKLKTQVFSQAAHSVVIMYGTGASKILKKWDLLIYADMARWEIQKRMKANRVNNLGVQNKDSDFAAKYKQAYFVDWRICDRIKINLLPKIDFLLDTNITNNPKMLTGNAFRKGLKQVARKPFRVVPFFDPGPWGGQWMKEVFDLDREVKNFAWCFDCVPEENSLLLTYGDKTVEIPSLNLIFYQPKEVLGKEIYEILGPEFPIRFDLLDTIDGGNLSLQVHPMVVYIKEQFGLTYTQDESYYMLDAKDGAFVYLGLKENINPDKMISELKAAQEDGEVYDADKHVQKWEVKKHDHILIPAGTVHCSGKNSMVLEISATPYIFTFKLWDWGRLGLDGKPRPIHIEHGKSVIQWDRTTEWTRENLINQVKEIHKNNDYIEEVTGLHDLQFIETRRHWFTSSVLHDTGGTLNVLNLVEGREVIVESPEGLFEPILMHYAESFIVPASVGKYTIRPYGESEGKKCATVKAFVRTDKLRNLGEDLKMI
ncbi:class I mannose-6-phosphate isomerase [soil metagenome]